MIKRRAYKVTYSKDLLDSKPTVKTFDCYDQMTEWIREEKARRIDQYLLVLNPSSVQGYFERLKASYSSEELEELERNLIRIEEV